jgi:S1-C subfamily serine protease
VEYGSVLGQTLRDSPQVIARGVPPGVCVRDVAPNSPAAKKLGDRASRLLITRVNGSEVTTPGEFYKIAMGQQSLKLTLLDPTEIQPREQEVTLP